MITKCNKCFEVKYGMTWLDEGLFCPDCIRVVIAESRVEIGLLKKENEALRKLNKELKEKDNG